MLITACAPCEFDSGIVRGTVTDAADDSQLDGGSVELTPLTGDVIEASIFGQGAYEASVPSGTYEVVAYDSAGECFSAIRDLEVEGCDELVIDFQIIDCF
ncbi:MAG: hypothetical protein KDA24_15400 [Deltaproteobacteria bacterium]|nr:hypothetical protein [Deltaproteobacteria bacterium]